MEYLIIGGGISGLYAAYALHKYKNIKKITVIEKIDSLGGRVFTKHIPNPSNKKELVTLEFGAAVMTEVHHNVLNLIKELGLENKLKVLDVGKRSHINFEIIKSEP